MLRRRGRRRWRSAGRLSRRSCPVCRRWAHRRRTGGGGGRPSLTSHFFFSSRRRHTRLVSDWSSDVFSSDLLNESSFRTEIVTCRVGRRRSPLPLFIKYGTSHFNRAFGHRGDVAFEARVYRDVLQPLRMSTPTFYGLYETGDPGVAWLIIAYVKGGIRTSQCPDPKAMIPAE